VKEDTQLKNKKGILKDPKAFSEWLEKQPWVQFSRERKKDDNRDTTVGAEGSKY
jgi:hypothetical protein